MKFCRKCRAELERFEMNSEGMQALNIFELRCPNGHRDPLKKPKRKAKR